MGTLSPTWPRFFHQSSYDCVINAAHRRSDLTLSRNDNERWASPPRASTPLPLACSPLTSAPFYKTNTFFSLLLSSAKTIASSLIQRGNCILFYFFTPVVPARIYKKRFGLDYHCNEEKNMCSGLWGLWTQHIMLIFRYKIFTVDLKPLKHCYGKHSCFILIGILYCVIIELIMCFTIRIFIVNEYTMW